MTQVHYLRKHYREDIPTWLADFDGSSEVELRDFFSSRSVFYPGAGTDGHPIEVFAASHSAHCFVYADYMITKDALKQELKKHPFAGYSIIYEKEYEENCLFELCPPIETCIPEDKRERVSSARNEMESRFSPYLYFIILERSPDLDDSYGAERIALLYCGTDAFTVFDVLYANGNVELFAALLEDYGFGGGYALFGGEKSLLRKIADNGDVYPEFLLSRPCSVWNDYTLIPHVDCTTGGMHQYERCLYKVNRSDLQWVQTDKNRWVYRNRVAHWNNDVLTIGSTRPVGCTLKTIRCEYDKVPERLTKLRCDPIDWEFSEEEVLNTRR